MMMMTFSASINAKAQARAVDLSFGRETQFPEPALILS